MSAPLQILGSLGLGLSFFGYLIGYAYYAEILKRTFGLDATPYYFFAWDYLLVRGVVIMTGFLWNVVWFAMLLYVFLVRVTRYGNVVGRARWMFFISFLAIILLNTLLPGDVWAQHPNILLRVVFFIAIVYFGTFLVLLFKGYLDDMEGIGAGYWALGISGTLIFFLSFVGASLGKVESATSVDKDGAYRYPKISVVKKAASSPSSAAKPMEFYLFSKHDECFFVFSAEDRGLRCLLRGEIESWRPVSKVQQLETVTHPVFDP